MSTIGTNVKRLREENKITQEQLATALNISYQAVSKWETGATIPDTLLLPSIAEFFGITIDELFRPNMVAYRHKGHRLFAVYESHPSSENFYAAESEMLKVINSAAPDSDLYFQAEDLRTLGNLYNYHMSYCRDTAVKYYDKAIVMGKPMRKKLYACFEQQKIYFMSQIGRGQECVDNYTTLINSEPDNCENYICAILSLYCCEKYNDAEKLCEAALSMWDDNVMVYYLSGDVYRKLKMYDKAFKYWGKSLELNKIKTTQTNENGFMDAMYSIADCYMEIGDKGKAYSAWKRIAEHLDEMGFTVEKEYAVQMMEKNK